MATASSPKTIKASTCVFTFNWGLWKHWKLHGVSTCITFAGLPCNSDHARARFPLDWTHRGTHATACWAQVSKPTWKRPLYSNEHVATPLRQSHTFTHLEAKGLLYTHLKSYILAVSCDACRAAIGKRENKTCIVALSKKHAIAQPKKTQKARRKLTQ